MPPPTRESLGRYLVDAEIGRGAMGVVYRAHDPKIDRIVAIKTISLAGQDPALEQQYREHFVQEARAAGRLSHPGIVTVYDAGEDPETQEPFFAMEYVAGRALSETLSAAGGRLPLPETLRLICEIADALDYAHSQGVVHGDIKPANILITEDGHAKIADFGVARLSQALSTHPGGVFGSPGYMAPEQISGRGCDARSDLFSVGVMLYSMLTGFRPFQGNSAQTICFKVVNVEPVPVSSFRAELPADLDRIVLKAIAKDPRERYQHGAELTRDIRALVANDTSIADATQFFTRVLEQEKNASETRSFTLSKRFLLQATAALIVIAWLLTGFELRKQYQAAATIEPPQPMVPVGPAFPLTRTPPAAKRVVRRVLAKAKPPMQAAPIAKLRIEILHHFSNGEASIWLDHQLVLAQQLRASDRHPLFRTVEMDQIANLQAPVGKHTVEIRVTSPPGTAGNGYDQTEELQAELGASFEHVLYVNCDKRKMQVKLQ